MPETREDQSVGVGYWSQFEEYTLDVAAYLMCNLEPRNATKANPPPTKVIDMIARMKRSNLEIIDTSEVVSSIEKYFVTEEPVLRKKRISGRKFVKRESLAKWCEDTGIKPAFLYPKDQHERLNDWPENYDTELLECVRYVIREYWNGKAPKSWPKKEFIIPMLCDKFGISINEARAVYLVSRHDSRRHKTKIR